MSTRSVRGIELGAAHELWLALAKAGFTPTLVQQVINSPGNQLAKQMFSVAQGGKVLRRKSKRVIIDLDAEPFIPEGWTDEEHQKGGQFTFYPLQLKFHLDPGQQNGKYIQGHQLHTQLKGAPVLNASLLDWYLTNPEHIPEAWKGKAVCFWGTIYRDSCGRSCVRFLVWHDDRWHWGARWLDSGWYGDYPALVRAST